MKREAAWNEYVKRVVAERLGIRESTFTVKGLAHTTDVEFYESVTLTYDELLSISRAFDTKAIDLQYRAGWGGTEVTPGDSSELELRISIGYDLPGDHQVGFAAYLAEQESKKRKPKKRGR